MKQPVLSRSLRLTLAMLLGLAVALTAASFSAFAQECRGIRESVLRLHILANSDSQEDQALKLAVRDRILELDSVLFQEASNLREAEEAAARELERIRSAAQEELRRQGCGYPVRAELTNMYFTTRTYDTLTRPAGRYDAVRITIGEGAGRNWWCVLYPPLCLPACGGQALSEVLTESQIEILESAEEYEFRFAALELYQALKERLENAAEE